MKFLKKSAAFLLVLVIVFSMTVNVFGVAEHDEDGNIIENEVLPGGIMTLGAELDPAFPGEDWLPLGIFVPISGQVYDYVYQSGQDYGHVIRIKRDMEDAAYPYSFVDFRLDFNSFLLGEFPQPGDFVTAFYDINVPVPMIYPPQYVAVAMVNMGPDAIDLPFVFVSRFDDDWISGDGTRRLRIGDDTEIIFQDGTSFEGELEELIGRKLVVEYYVSHRDIPETIPNPPRVTVLFERIVFGPEPIFDFDLYNDLDADYPVEGHPIFDTGYNTAYFDWTRYPVIIEDVGVPGATLYAAGDSIFPNYVSLRAVTEFLGFVPKWDGELRQVVVPSSRGDISFRIGSSYFALVGPEINEGFTLDLPAIIVNDKTYVPIRFFRDVFGGFNNVWFEGGHLFMDNHEVME